MGQTNTGLLLEAKRVFLCLSWLMFLQSGTAEGVRLTPLHQAPYYRQAPVGSSLDFNCEVNDPNATVRFWQMTNFGTMYTPTENVVRNGQRFTRHKLMQNAQGNYLCKASSAKGRVTISLGRLLITPAPKDPPLPIVRAMQIGIVGEDVNITCTASGDAISAVQWFKRGVRITRGKERVTMHDGKKAKVFTNIMQLTNLEKKDTYVYECRVFTSNNTAWFWAARTFLSVQDSPLCPRADGLFADPKSNKSYIECVRGVSTRKNCSLGTEWHQKENKCLQPAKVLRWTSKQTSSHITKKSAGESHSFDCRLNDPGVRVILKQKAGARPAWQRQPDGCKITRVGQTFTLHALQSSVDQGIFSCAVLGVRMTPKIVGILTVAPGPWYSFGKGRNLIAPVGSSVDLDCAGYDIPRPMLSLQLVTFDGRSILLTPDGKKVVQNDQVFTINSLARDMRGSVHCRVASSCNRKAPKSVDIGYLLPMPNTKPLPSPAIQPSIYTARLGDDVTFTCSASGDNLREFSWYRSTGLITEGTSRISENSSVLRLRRVSDFDAGVYHCRVKGVGVGYWVTKAELEIAVDIGASEGILSGTLRSVNRSLFGEITVNCKLRPPHLTMELLQEKAAKSILRRPDGVKVLLIKQVFTIRQLDYSDEGLYSCSAPGLRPVPKINLLLVKLRNQTEDVILAGKNETVTLRCNFGQGNPTTTISWWYQPCAPGKPSCESQLQAWSRLHNSSSNQIVVLARDGHALHKCIAQNNIGEATTIFLVLRFDLKPPRILDFLTRVTVNSSQDIKLVCNVDGTPLPNVAWTKDGQQVGACVGELLSPQKTCGQTGEGTGARYRVRWIGSGSELHVENAIHPFDAGNFTCMAVSLIGQDMATVEITIQEKPVLHGEASLVRLPFQAAKTLRLNAVQGHPEPQFKWYFQKIRDKACLLGRTECQPNPATWRRVRRDIFAVFPPNETPASTSSIFIPPLKHEFFYRCVAENTVGKDHVTFSVYRYYSPGEVLPKISTTPSGAVVDEEDELTLTCTGDLFDLDALTWDRPGMKVAPIVSTRGTTKSINVTIKSTQLTDAGVYACVGWTMNDTKSAQVTINVKALTVPSASLSNQTLNEKEANETSLHCAVSAGYPRPEITWFRNGQKLKSYLLALGEGCRYNGFYHRKGDEPPYSEHLVICKPSHAHNTGWYECRANNKRGNHTAQAYLDITAPPRIVELQEGTLTHEIGDKVIKTCKATGNPEPSIRWIKKSKNRGIDVAHGEGGIGVPLRIDELREEDFGEYVCIAENEHGNSTVRLAIVQKSPRAARSGTKLSGSNTILIVSATSAILAIILLVLLLILVRRRKLYGGFYICSFPPAPDFIDSLDPSIPLYEQIHKLPYDENWEFPREQLHLKHILGSGAFGAVYYAEADSAIITDSSSVSVRHKLASSQRRRNRRGSAVSQGPTKVAVKTLKEGAGEVEYKDLVSELKILIHVGAHMNIVNLLGACTKGREYDLCVIIEYCPHGSLLKFLRARRESYEAKWLPPSDQDDGCLYLENLVSCSYQVARAMEFLASRKCVHRDLAARNVLVGENYVIKVADFGLARDVYKDDQYVKQSSGLVPVKWMAIESLADNFYSQKSDVWSFGVLLWEMFTLGGNPYPNLPPTDVYMYLAEGGRMECPEDCPEFIRTIMMNCWMHNPDDRPVFAELVKRLEHFIESNMGKETYLELKEDAVEAVEVDGYLQPIDEAPFVKTPSGTKQVKLTEVDEKKAEVSPGQLKIIEPTQMVRYTELGITPSKLPNVSETNL